MRILMISVLVLGLSISTKAQQNGGEPEAVVSVKTSKKRNPLTEYVMDKYGSSAEQILLSIYSYQNANGVVVMTPKQFEAKKDDETGRFVSIESIEDQIKY